MPLRGAAAKVKGALRAPAKRQAERGARRSSNAPTAITRANVRGAVA